MKGLKYGYFTRMYQCILIALYKNGGFRTFPNHNNLIILSTKTVLILVVQALLVVGH